MLKMPGAVGALLMTDCAEGTPLRVTTTVAVPVLPPLGRTFQGNCALICPPDTKSRPAVMPLKVTPTLSASEVERGTVSFCCRFAARFVPKIDTSCPGASGAPADLSKLAAFNTPPGTMVGVWHSAAAAHKAARRQIRAILMS